MKITAVHGHGDYDKEYVFLQVLEDVDIGNYMLADTTYNSDGSVSNKLRHTYLFPSKAVKKGDYISLWTRPGTNTVGATDKGIPIHRFYWGLKEAVWNDDGDCAILYEVSNRQFHRAKAK